MLTMPSAADVADERRRAVAHKELAGAWGEEGVRCDAAIATIDWWEGGPGPVTGRQGSAVMDEQRAAADAEQADIRAWRSNAYNGMANLTIEWLRGASPDRPI